VRGISEGIFTILKGDEKMKIKNKKQVEESLVHLDAAMSLLNKGIKLDDSDLGGEYDYYRRVNNIIDDIDGDLG
jgi:hypothetical protein